MAIYEFNISNPSPYPRTDYVQIDLDKLNVKDELSEKNLTLYRKERDGSPQKIPFQIDTPFGENTKPQIMTFLSADTPPGKDDYKSESASFILEDNASEEMPAAEDLSIHHYYTERKEGEPVDGHNDRWFKDRPVYSVKLKNSAIEVSFKLLPGCTSPKGFSYSGSATSVSIWVPDLNITDECLSSFLIGDNPNKRWGQICELAFYPFPWEHKWFHKVNMLDKKYDLVWSKKGPIRATVTLKSAPFSVPYNGVPFFDKKLEIECNLYRVIYVYAGWYKPYYMEELFVLTKEGQKLLSFRPYCFSDIYPPHDDFTNVKRFENIPDYFAVWKHFPYNHRGYGFASDAHIRRLEVKGSEIRWRFSLARHFKCIHYFMAYTHLPVSFDPFHTIGHNGWYEKIYKPIESFNYSLRFPAQISEID